MLIKSRGYGFQGNFSTFLEAEVSNIPHKMGEMTQNHVLRWAMRIAKGGILSTETISMIILALGKDLTKNGVSSDNSNQYLQSVRFMNYSYCHAN